MRLSDLNPHLARTLRTAVLLWGLLPCAAARPACDASTPLRIVVLCSDPKPVGDAQGKFTILMNDVQKMLWSLRQSSPELSAPEFAYLDKLRLEPAANAGSPSAYELGTILRDQRTDVLELVYPVVVVDGSKVIYQHAAFLGSECGFSDCLFTDSQYVPPSARYSIVKEYYRVLTLYALGVDALRANCSDTIAKTLFALTIKRIDELRSGDKEFERIREIRSEAERRLNGMRVGLTP